MRNDERRDLFFDGQNFTISSAGTNTYATTKAPPTVDQMLEVVGEKLDVHPPGADLPTTNPYAILTEQAQSGKWLGKSRWTASPWTGLV